MPEVRAPFTETVQRCSEGLHTQLIESMRTKPHQISLAPAVHDQDPQDHPRKWFVSGLRTWLAQVGAVYPGNHVGPQNEGQVAAMSKDNLFLSKRYPKFCFGRLVVH